MLESESSKRIALELSRQGFVTWRNNTGFAWQGVSTVHDRSRGVLTLRNPRPIRFGLAEGSSDRVGLLSIVITPEMVGKKIAVFTAVECKSERGRTSKEQENFLGVIERAGGIAFVAKTAADVVGGLRTWINQITTK